MMKIFVLSKMVLLILQLKNNIKQKEEYLEQETYEKMNEMIIKKKLRKGKEEILQI